MTIRPTLKSSSSTDKSKKKKAVASVVKKKKIPQSFGNQSQNSTPTFGKKKKVPQFGKKKKPPQFGKKKQKIPIFGKQQKLPPQIQKNAPPEKEATYSEAETSGSGSDVEMHQQTQSLASTRSRRASSCYQKPYSQWYEGTLETDTPFSEFDEEGSEFEDDDDAPDWI